MCAPMSPFPFHVRGVSSIFTTRLSFASLFTITVNGRPFAFVRTSATS